MDLFLFGLFCCHARAQRANVRKKIKALEGLGIVTKGFESKMGKNFILFSLAKNLIRF